MAGPEDKRKLPRLPLAKKLPRFHDEAEMAEFFDTHDVSELLESWTLVPGPIIDARKPLKSVALQLPADTIAAIKRIANEKGLAYQGLLRIWILEGLTRETKRARPGSKSSPIPARTKGA
jgi:predicted DNA binding CopG/RHH family protein